MAGSDWVEAFGTLSVSLMVLFYALEERGAHFTACFAVACLASSGYGAAIGAWPFAAVELIWAGLAFRRWARRR